MKKSLSSYLPLIPVLAAISGVCDANAATYAIGGTSRAYAAAVDRTIAAITNGFSSNRYHDMTFLAAVSHYDPSVQRWIGPPTTNEWMLYSVSTPLKMLPKGKKVVPYFANFNITASQTASNQSRVTVRTIWASIADGKELGIHGGRASHSERVQPILEEEANVLSEIELQLSAPPGGLTNRVVKTPDWDADAERQRQWRDIAESDPKAKNELIKAIQAETRPGFKEELLKILKTMTNSPPKAR